MVKLTNRNGKYRCKLSKEIFYEIKKDYKTEKVKNKKKIC